MTLAKGMPAAFPAGTTVEFTQEADAYPAADGWALELMMAGPSVLSEALEADVDVNTGERSFTIDSVTCAALAMGLYRYQVHAVDDSVDPPIRKLVAKGDVNVTLDLFNAEPGDALSFYERALVVLYAAFESRIPKGLEGFQIYNRTVSLMPLEKVAELIALFEAKVAEKKRRARGLFSRQIRVRFTGVANERL